MRRARRWLGHNRSRILAGSMPRWFPPTPVVLIDWESTIPTPGCGFLPYRHHSRSRSSAFSSAPICHRYATV